MLICSLIDYDCATANIEMVDVVVVVEVVKENGIALGVMTEERKTNLSRNMC